MKNVSLKQASGLTEGFGPSDPPPGSTNASFTPYSWAENQAGSLILITILGLYLNDRLFFAYVVNRPFAIRGHVTLFL